MSLLCHDFVVNCDQRFEAQYTWAFSCIIVNCQRMCASLFHATEISLLAGNEHRGIRVKLEMLLSVPTGNKLPRLYRIYVLQPAVAAALHGH